MYRERCRPSYPSNELKEIYSKPWAMHQDWGDHIRRIEATAELSSHLVVGCETAADLSCGDAHWAHYYPHLRWSLGDYAFGYEYRGPIEKTIKEIPEVDIFFCCETIEHLDDPDFILREIREKSQRLVLSTPNSYQFDENPEHYWAFDREMVGAMLEAAGWTPVNYLDANGWNDPTRVNGYAFQIWGCV